MYESMTVRELREICKSDSRFAGYTTALKSGGKARLVEFMLECDSNSKPEMNDDTLREILDELMPPELAEMKPLFDEPKPEVEVVRIPYNLEQPPEWLRWIVLGICYAILFAMDAVELLARSAVEAGASARREVEAHAPQWGVALAGVALAISVVLVPVNEIS